MTRGLWYALLLGTAFLAGVAVGPASTLIGRQFERDLGVDAAFAQDSAVSVKVVAA
jgi:hypothetical protein